MSRFILGILAVLVSWTLVPALSWAEDPHFEVCDASVIGGAVVVSGQVAGLGNQMRPPTPLHLEATVTTLCLDPATTPPTVVGSATASADITYPPKNGNRKYAFAVTDPVPLVCVAPAEVAVSIVVCDTTHAICCNPLLPPEPE